MTTFFRPLFLKTGYMLIYQARLINKHCNCYCLKDIRRSIRVPSEIGIFAF